jgi:hypothetical protein
MRANSDSSGGIGERSLTSWGGTPAWAKKLIRRSAGQPVAGSSDSADGRALVLTRGARVLSTQSERTPPSTKAGCTMATPIVFLSGHETAVTGTEDEVVQVVRRGHSNQVNLEGIDGVVLCVNWPHITSAPGPCPVL